MIEQHFSAFTEVTLFQMHLQLSIRKKTLLACDAAPVIEANVTELAKKYQN